MPPLRGLWRTLARRDEANAEKGFRPALAINPAYFPAAAALSRARLEKKDFVGARAEIENILRADAKNLDALIFLANIELHFIVGRRL
jgi:Tfp pilus assembly protein PilF